MLRPAAVVLLTSLAACADADVDAAPSTTLSVFAASSLTDVLGELSTRFEELNPDVDVRLTFAGSQVLRFQIEQGAAGDIFVSANEAHMRALEEAGHVHRSGVLAETDLVVIVPLHNPAAIERFDQLDRASRIVLGTEYVPVGVYARRVIENAATTIGPDFGERVRSRVVSMESNVRLVRAKVELGEADAALVYRPDAHSSKGVRMIPIPDELNVRATFPIARTTRGVDDPVASRFLSFVASPQAVAILEAHGFTPGPS